MKVVQTVKNEVLNLIKFSKKLKFVNEDQSFKQNLSRYGVLLLLDLAILVILTILFYGLSAIGFHEIFKNNQAIEVFNEYPLWLIVLFMSCLIPLIEEVFFRFPFKYRRITINFLVPILLILSIGYAQQINISFVKIFITILSLASLVYFILKNKMLSNKFAGIWHKKFKFVFYTSTLLFALMHLTNYKFSYSLILLAPLLILPQFCGGFLIGYLRIKSGFFWGLALHMTSNLILLLPYIIALTLAFPPLNIYTKSYDLTVRKIEVNLSKTEIFSSFSKDSIIIKNQSFKKCLSILTDKKENLIEFNDSFESGGIPLLKANQSLHISYKNKKILSNNIEKVIFNSKRNIINELVKAYNFTLSYDNDSIIVVFN